MAPARRDVRSRLTFGVDAAALRLLLLGERGRPLGVALYKCHAPARVERVEPVPPAQPRIACARQPARSAQVASALNVAERQVICAS
jgi:hypothetical protein